MLTVRVPWQVEYAVKHEMAVTVKDMLSLRMRLAYINSEAAKQAIPRVAELMAQHLKWSKKEKNRQVKLAEDYLGQFGGPVSDKKGAKLRQVLLIRRAPTTHHSPLTTHHSPLTTHHSPLTTHHSVRVRDSGLQGPCRLPGCRRGCGRREHVHGAV